MHQSPNDQTGNNSEHNYSMKTPDWKKRFKESQKINELLFKELFRLMDKIKDQSEDHVIALDLLKNSIFRVKWQENVKDASALIERYEFQKERLLCSQ